MAALAERAHRRKPAAGPSAALRSGRLGRSGTRHEPRTSRDSLVRSSAIILCAVFFLGCRLSPALLASMI